MNKLGKCSIKMKKKLRATTSLQTRHKNIRKFPKIRLRWTMQLRTLYRSRCFFMHDFWMLLYYRQMRGPQPWQNQYCVLSDYCKWSNKPSGAYLSKSVSEMGLLQEWGLLTGVIFLCSKKVYKALLRTQNIFRRVIYFNNTTCPNQ